MDIKKMIFFFVYFDGYFKFWGSVIGCLVFIWCELGFLRRRIVINASMCDYIDGVCIRSIVLTAKAWLVELTV